MNHVGFTLAAVAAAGVLAAGAGAAPVSYSDPAGDSGAAPDITNVAVNDSGGALTIVVTAAAALTPGQTIDVFLNTDKNDSTGSPSGSEFNVEAWQADGDWGWDMASWSGGDWKETPSNPDEHFSRSGNIYTWTVPLPELGGATGFTFWIGGTTADANGNVTASDRAPDGGSWVYDLAAKPAAVVPAIGKALAVPAAPRAGTLLSLSFPVTPATGGTAVASATLNAKPIPRTASLANGTAQVAIALPKNARGKTLVVKVTVTVGGKSATRTISYRVK
jgi:hypothetical protein